MRCAFAYNTSIQPRNEFYYLFSLFLNTNAALRQFISFVFSSINVTWNNKLEKLKKKKKPTTRRNIKHNYDLCVYKFTGSIDLTSGKRFGLSNIIWRMNSLDLMPIKLPNALLNMWCALFFSRQCIPRIKKTKVFLFFDSIHSLRTNRLLTVRSRWNFWRMPGICSSLLRIEGPMVRIANAC